MTASSQPKDLLDSLPYICSMVIPLHMGIGHPNLVWLSSTAILSFIAGMGVNVYRSATHERHQTDSPTPEENT
jgi:hypothetical protein